MLRGASMNFMKRQIVPAIAVAAKCCARAPVTAPSHPPPSVCSTGASVATKYLFSRSYRRLLARRSSALLLIIVVTLFSQWLLSTNAYPGGYVRAVTDAPHRSTSMLMSSEPKKGSVASPTDSEHQEPMALYDPTEIAKLATSISPLPSHTSDEESAPSYVDRM